MIRCATFFKTKLLFTLPMLLLFIINETGTLKAQDRPFITTWETTEDNESITIGPPCCIEYDFAINWGDGTVENISGEGPNPSHTYEVAGSYTVEITGVFLLFQLGFAIL